MGYTGEVLYLISKINLVGGEPLLYPYLGDVLDYLNQHYKRNYDELCIFTNGTIIPSEDIVRKLEKYRVVVKDSNYGKIAKAHKQLVKTLRAKGVSVEKLHLPWLNVRQLLQKGDNRKAGERCVVYCYCALGDKFYNCAFLAHGDLIGAFPFDKSNFLKLTERTTLADIETYIRQSHPACCYCSGSDYRKRIFVKKAAQTKVSLPYKKYPR